MVYEALVLFGLVMVIGLAYGLISQQRHALAGRLGLQIAVFVALGAYFVWFWCHGGQTVAMRAWQLRVVRDNGAPLSWSRAAMRYLASWMWCLPALPLAQLVPWNSQARLWAVLAAWMTAYVASAALTGDRRFWHDRLCGTVQVVEPPSRQNARP